MSDTRAGLSIVAVLMAAAVLLEAREARAGCTSTIGASCSGVGNGNGNCCTGKNLACPSGTCTCAAGYSPSGGLCVACTAESDTTFCTRLGKNCGAVTANDNCGTARTVTCGGACTAPNTCGGSGTPNVCGCAAESDSAFCTRLGQSCGSASGTNNCGAAKTVVSCGTCTAPQTCGGGGTAGACGCGSSAESDSAFCARLGKTCGAVSGNDICGAPRTVASCGTCTAPQTCGGGGSPNVCAVCAPESDAAFCSRLGRNCGAVTANDNCGAARTVASCGSCTAPQTCGAVNPNVCGCAGGGLTCDDFPNQCAASLADGCGGTIDCRGACAAPQSCGGGGTPAYCGCAGTVCAAYGWACGQAPGCANSVNCGSCSGTDQCVNNKCQACIDASYNARACASSAECCQDVDPLTCVATKCCVSEEPVCCGNYCDQTYTCSNDRLGPGVQHFAGETLIIPNDCANQDEMLAYGFVYRLLQAGITVNWAINHGKSSQTGVDFTLPTGTSMQRFTWAGGGGSWTALATPVLSFQGGPFIVSEPASVIKLKGILDGTRPWSYRGCFDGNVTIYRVTATYDAPIYNTLNRPPGKFMLHDPRGGALGKELGGGFGSGTGCDPEGSVWHTIGSTSEITALDADGRPGLNTYTYSGFWTSKYSSNFTAAESAVIHRFVDAGGTIMAQSDSVGALENAPGGNYQSSGGVDQCTPNNSLLAYFGEPEMQMCPDGIFKEQGGWKGWHPTPAPSAWTSSATNPARWVRLYEGDSSCAGFSGGQKDGSLQKGWMYYMQGHSSVGGGQHVNVKRILLGVLLKQSVTMRIPNLDRVVARSAPVVDETAALLYQGTRTVNCNQRTTFGGGTGCGYLFPYYTGDAAVTPTSALGTSASAATLTYADIAGRSAWDPATTLAAQVANEAGSGTRPKRWIFTAVGSGSSWARTDFAAANASALSTSTPGTGLSATDTATLIAGVRTGGFGGVDHATPAIIEAHTLTNPSRPTVAYVAALDGMLHALCADTAGCTVNATSYQVGEELWAFIPPSQLPLLKSNTQGLDASPRVEDLQARYHGAAVASWKTVLVLAEGSFGKNVYGLDVTDPANPQLLWQANGTPTTGTGAPTMGNSNGAALGMAAATPSKALVWVSSDISGGRGLAVYALDAADGTFAWWFRHDYAQRKYAGMTVDTPNDIPAPPAVAPTTASGALDRLFIGDFDGNVWQLDATTGGPAGTNPLFTTATAGQPIGAPLAITRGISGGHLMVVAGTGGADWTLAGPLGDQFALYVIDATTRAYRTIGAGVIPVGERVFAQPVVRGQEAFAASTSTGMNQPLDCTSDLSGGTGTLYRANLENSSIAITTLNTGTIAGFDVGSTSGTVVAGGMRGETRAPSPETATGASTTSASLEVSAMGGQAKMWLQRF
ncbi:MAG TPA: hypothetical protein VGQ83_34115 [Polyangia bacterium]|jgi:hypothetical protein